MGVHHAKAMDSPYYPTRYFHWQVVAWIIKHRQLVYRNKYLALMANYRLAEETPQFKGPLSFKVIQGHFTSCITGRMLLVTLLVTLLYMLTFPGHVTGCIVLFAVKADEDLSKYVLECSRLSHTLWKHRFLQDTEDEAAVAISSEDEADSMPLVDHQVRRAVRPTPAAPALPAAAAGSTATVSTAATASMGTSTDAPQCPAPDEVVVKKSALLTMKRQMAALIQGEELPAGGAGARDTPDVPYQVPAIGREDTQYPISHLSYKTPCHLRQHMDVC